MRGVRAAVAAGMAVAALSMVAAATAGSDSAAKGQARAEERHAAHDLKHPLGAKQRGLRQQALMDKLAGKAKGKVHEVAKGQYVELAREGTDNIFVIIAEFGNTRHPAFPDNSPLSTATVFDGPLHNKIPPPDRTKDNTTIWQADYNRAHYDDMYFNRMARYYESQSSGRYSVEGDVTEWVKVPFNEARYGRSGDVNNIDPAVCASIVCNNTWFLIRDAMAFWVKEQLDSGRTLAQVQEYLKTFDTWDRYDFDGDGNFNERDGYIDHFQIVHAGGDEAAGDPQQGTDAIWSHRWYAQITPIGSGGPTGLAPFGGVNAGEGGISGGVTVIPDNRTDVWVGDYTIQPENGGLGVFAHEYGHDLGLPDLYDTSGNTCPPDQPGCAENSTGFWTLMSSGANAIGPTADGGIGLGPVDMGAWEKFQLGWLNYEVAFAGQKSEHKLGPAETNTKQAQGLFVVLPQSLNPSVLNLGVPTSGTKAYWSGMGDNLDRQMTRDVTLPAGGPISLSLKAWYEIETCWDYAYLRVSQDGGTTWTNLDTSVSDDGNENGQNFGNGITGISGSPKHCDEAEGNPAWVPVTADLTPYAGKTVKLAVRYWTDGFVQGRGFEWDDLAITAGGTSVLTDDAESGAGWTLGGFASTTGSQTRFDPHYYLAEFRQYRGYDANLRTGPYNFGFLNTLPDWVERIPYQDGLLVNYWDTGQADNSTSNHPGEGLLLPIDAHPKALMRPDDATKPWRSRVQGYDSTFGFQPTDSVTVHFNGIASVFPSLPAAPIFDDRQSHWDANAPMSSVKHPTSGTQVRIKSVSAQGSFMQVQVTPAG